MPGVAVAVAASPVAQAGGAGGGALEWWQGYSAPALLAYDGLTAASLAAAQVNLANPGTYDLTVVGTGGTLDPTYGLYGNAGGGWSTGYTAVPSGGKVANLTAAVWCSKLDWTSRLFGTVTLTWGTADAFGFMADTYMAAANGQFKGSLGGGAGAIVYLIVGQALYRAGSLVATLTGTAMVTSSILQLCNQSGRRPGVMRAALFNGVFNAGDIADISSRMLA